MDQLTPGLRERLRDEWDRAERAGNWPHRSGFDDSLDPKLECTLGRLRARGLISQDEYKAAETWRVIHTTYLKYLYSPEEFTDEQAESLEANYSAGLKILMNCGKRVFHAVSAIGTYEEPEGLGDFQFTVDCARVGYGALAKHFRR
jgi:hypothetical protein